MKLGQPAALLFFALLNASAAATTLKLPQDIELIAVDGQKVSSSLLKGADSLELDNDQHQLLFRVVKVINTAGSDKKTYTSPSLLAAFNMQHLDAVIIQLPPLDTPMARERFNHEAHYQLLDHRQTPIDARVDTLALTDDDIANRLESILAQYNTANKAASVAAFATPTPHEKSWPDNSSATPQDGIDPFLILKYWFRQADKKTQERFLEWAKERDGR